MNSSNPSDAGGLLKLMRAEGDSSSSREPSNRNGSPPPTSQQDPAAMYRRFCAECGCRVNSAVTKILEGTSVALIATSAADGSHASVDANEGKEGGSLPKPLTQVTIRNCYIGPKGFYPVALLIEAFQTIEVVDVRGNGLDNACAQRLCQALERHLGVTTVLCGDNPITVDGGKLFVPLLERNRHIIECDVSGTDVYEAMRNRIAFAVDENCKLQRERVGLVPSKPPPNAGDSQRPLVGRPAAKVELRLLSEKSIGESSALMNASNSAVASQTRTPASTVKKQATPSYRGPAPDSASSTTAAEGPTVTAPKPRPPPPALASKETSRMSEKQRQELLAKYHERAQLYQQVLRSDASRAADKARQELVMIEQQKCVNDASGRVISSAGRKGGSPQKRSTSPTSRDRAITRPRTPQQDIVVNTSQGGHSPLRQESPKTARLVGDATNTVDLRVVSGARWSVSDLPTEDDTASVASRVTNPIGSPTRRPTLPRDQLDSTDGQEDTVLQKPLTLQPLTLSRDEQFRELFARGCQQYNDKLMDAAYLTWNEAMDLAATSKNREWMAVISNNLQRLSYEILVAEGVRHLESHRLDEADRTFVLALDVANKAKNAAWCGEMHRARKSVQHAVFQSSHEAALRLFERAKAQRDVKVTSDDRFSMPGDDPSSLKSYGSEFVSEWSRMLLIKEAMEMWADACMISRRIGGNSAKMLQDVITASVNSVSAHLAHRFYVSEPNGNILSLQGTSKYARVEAMKLLELWTDLVSKTQTTLSNRVWDAIAASELGNLFLATHQLPQALNQFEKLVDIGTDTSMELFSALGHTYCGILHWQRSNFATSEKHIAIALEHWKVLRVQRGRLAAVPTEEVAAAVQAQGARSPMESPEGQDVIPMGRSPGHEELFVESAVSGGRAATDTSVILQVSREYLDVMLKKCYTYLIRNLFTTSRHRDALEMLERGLLNRFHDRLHEKMVHNFTAKPTLDHISAVASAQQSPLVYYETSYRFEWVTALDAYRTSQQLMVWVVPPDNSQEMKVVRVDVTSDFGVDSLDELIGAVRKHLVVEPMEGVESSMVTTLPEQGWKEPLRLLYDILVYPIEDFIRAHDPQTNHKGGLVTIIPSSSLWLCPFSALVTRSGKYWVEEYAIQMSYNAIQSVYSALSATRTKERDHRRRSIVVQTESHSEIPMMRSILEQKLVFPLDSWRSAEEGKRIAAVMGNTAGSPSARSPAASPSGGTISTSGAAAGPIELVEDLLHLRDVLTRSRFLHIATPVSSVVENDDGCSGAIVVPTGQDELGFLKASEISKCEIFSELAVLSNCNIIANRIRGTKEGVHGICRSLLSAGVSAVIAGMWCTPDMVPAEFFETFYHVLFSRKETHKAKALAIATRRLLMDDQFRYSPRLWSGFFVVGAGQVS